MSKVTASVVLYNTPQALLENLFHCIERSSLELHLYLVDNSPRSMESLAPKRPWITYERARGNVGYGAGHNIALRKVLDVSTFHFVLNPDISFGPEELDKMIQFVEANPNVGQLMPKVVYPDGSLQYLCKLVPTPGDLFLRRFAAGPFKSLARNRIERFELQFTGYDKVMDVPYLSGCFMLFRVSALRRIGLFDERFFMYPEDIDITRRMNAQFRTVFFPGATVIHDHARESYVNTRALLIHINNMIKYFNKWGWFYDLERSRINKKTLQQFPISSGGQ